jgi:hypothetical protein
MFCSKCGTQLNEGSVFCARCGTRATQAAGQTTEDISLRSRLATSLLAIIVGWLGAHRFYAGKFITASAMLMVTLAASFFWVIAMIHIVNAIPDDPAWPWIAPGALLALVVLVWLLIDFIMVVSGSFRDNRGKPIKKW